MLNEVTVRSTSLTAARRSRDLSELAGGAVVDVLVVGGGIAGVGVALDAASRGLDVALVERSDLASGTSGFSSKLIHGGLRYLLNLELSVALESAHERELLMRTVAPHLIEPVPFVAMAETSMPRWTRTALWAAILAGEGLRVAARGLADGPLPRGRRLHPREAALLVPALRRAGLAPGPMWWEGRLEDDARLVVAVARTAAGHGARVLTYCEAESVAGDGAQVRDRLGGGRFDIRARDVVVCAGVWANALSPDVELKPSKGAHLLVPAERLGRPRAAFIAPVPDELARVVFAVPRPEGLMLIGVTDGPVEGPPPDVAVVDDADVHFLLQTVNQVLDDPLRVVDVVGTFAGFRPLIAGGAGATADLSRRHQIRVDPEGVTHVMGGKLTTYRAMARDAVDRIAARSKRAVPASRTERLPLVGASDRAALDRIHAPRQLVRRFGTEATRVAALADPNLRLREPVVDGAPTLGVEFAFGILHEGAMTVADLLDRRTRLGLVAEHRNAAEQVAEHLLSTLRDS